MLSIAQKKKIQDKRIVPPKEYKKQMEKRAQQQEELAQEMPNRPLRAPRTRTNASLNAYFEAPMRLPRNSAGAKK